MTLFDDSILLRILVNLIWTSGFFFVGRIQTVRRYRTSSKLSFDDVFHGLGYSNDFDA